MKQALIALLFSTLPLFAEAPWPGVPFSEVRAYAWPDDKVTEQVILTNRSLKPGVLNPEGALLTVDEVAKLITSVNGKHEKHPVASCHIPHNAFVLYDANKKPVAFVEICFGCLNRRIEPAGASDYPYLPALAEIFAAHQLPMGQYPDYPSFKKNYDDRMANYGTDVHYLPKGKKD